MTTLFEEKLRENGFNKNPLLNEIYKDFYNDVNKLSEKNKIKLYEELVEFLKKLTMIQNAKSIDDKLLDDLETTYVGEITKVSKQQLATRAFKEFNRQCHWILIFESTHTTLDKRKLVLASSYCFLLTAGLVIAIGGGTLAAVFCPTLVVPMTLVAIGLVMCAAAGISLLALAHYSDKNPSWMKTSKTSAKKSYDKMNKAYNLSEKTFGQRFFKPVAIAKEVGHIEKPDRDADNHDLFGTKAAV